MNNWQTLIQEMIDQGHLQQDIARAAGLSDGFISQIKSGRRGEKLCYASVQKLAKAYRTLCGRELRL